MINKEYKAVVIVIVLHASNDESQRFCAGSAWGAITRGELCAEAEDDQGGRGENGIRGQRSSVDKCKVQREASP